MTKTHLKNKLISKKLTKLVYLLEAKCVEKTLLILNEVSEGKLIISHNTHVHFNIKLVVGYSTVGNIIKFH
jgi:hypothetical protein